MSPILGLFQTLIIMAFNFILYYQYIECEQGMLNLNAQPIDQPLNYRK